MSREEMLVKCTPMNQLLMVGLGGAVFGAIFGLTGLLLLVLGSIIIKKLKDIENVREHDGSGQLIGSS